MRRERGSPPYCLRFLLTQTLLGGEMERQNEERGGGGGEEKKKEKRKKRKVQVYSGAAALLHSSVAMRRLFSK